MKCFHCSKEISYLINCPLCSKNLCSYSCLEFHKKFSHNNLNNNKTGNININQGLSPKMDYINYKKYSVFSPFITEGIFEKENIKYDKKYNLDNFIKEARNGKPIEIGTGSYGNIFLCRNKIDNKLYARKYMNKDFLIKKLKSLSPIYNEIYFQSRITHQNIVRLLYVKETNDNFELIMEYANRGNLYNYIIKKTHLSEQESFKFFSQIANAIYFLHKNDLIHRDIKPENILLFENDLCKLCDFGWCARLNGKQRNTFCGTPEYMSPEIIDKMEYGKEVDVWSLGILLYEMIHGISPFRPKNALSLEKVMESIKIHNLKFRSDVSEECKDLICHLLDENVERRYKIEDIFNSKFFKKYENKVLASPITYTGSDSKGQSNKNINIKAPESPSFKKEKYQFETPQGKNNKKINLIFDENQNNFNLINSPANDRYYFQNILTDFSRQKDYIKCRVTKMPLLENKKIISYIENSPHSSIKPKRPKSEFKSMSHAKVTPISYVTINNIYPPYPIYNNPFYYRQLENNDYNKSRMHSFNRPPVTVTKLNSYDEILEKNNNINSNIDKNNIKPIINNYQTNLMNIIKDDSPKDNIEHRNKLFNNNTSKRSQVIKINSPINDNSKGNDLLKQYNYKYPSLKKHHYFKSNLSAIKEMDDFIQMKKSPSLELMQVKKNLNNTFKPLSNYNTYTNTNSNFYRPKIKKIIPKMPKTISRVKSFNYIRKKVNSEKAKPFLKPKILSFYNNRFKNLKIDKKDEISLNGDDNITKINTYQNNSPKFNTLEDNNDKTNTNSLINSIDSSYKMTDKNIYSLTDATNTIKKEINTNNYNGVSNKEPRKKNKKIMKLIEEHNRKVMMEKILKKRKYEEYNKDENQSNEIIDDNNTKKIFDFNKNGENSEKINNNLGPKLFSVKTFNINEPKIIEEMQRTPRKTGDKTKITPNQLLNRFSLKLKTFSN